MSRRQIHYLDVSPDIDWAIGCRVRGHALRTRNYQYRPVTRHLIMLHTHPDQAAILDFQ